MVTHKRFDLSEKGRIVAEDFLGTPWIDQPLGDLDHAFCKALALRDLPQVDFHALYRGMVDAVLARCCAELTGRFVLDGQPGPDRKRRLERCHELQREIGGLRGTIHQESRFADRVELNTQIKELEARLSQATAKLDDNTREDEGSA
jgi:hypothetical protein